MMQRKHALVSAAGALAFALACASAVKAEPIPGFAQAVGSMPGGAAKYFTVNLTATATPQQVHSVATYFRSFGLAVTEDPRDELLFVRGTYSQAAAAAHTSYAIYQDAAQRFVSTTGPERYPDAVARSIVATTIDDGPSAMSFGMIANPDKSVGPPGGFTTSDIATYYNFAPIYSAGVKGSGVKVAILACNTVVTGDITKFESDNGLPSSVPKIVDVDGGNAVTGLEPTGDVERVVGTAPDAAVTLYVTGTGNCTLGNLADGVAKILSDDATDHYAAMSHSYGATEDYYNAGGFDSDMTAEESDFSGLLKDNTTAFIASGDTGAFTPFAELLENGEVTVQYPASDPNVISVGGTDATAMSSTNFTRLQELAWGLSGGGVSIKWAIPSWQKSVKGIASTTMRNLPDVALDAGCGTPYFAVWTPEGGTQGDYGFCGTSFAAPTWAGLLALVDSGRIAAGKKKLTNVPDEIYTKHGTSGMFLDMTAGTNGYYLVGKGYDNVTGFGVPNADIVYTTLEGLP
jgi:kumamolisin